MKSPESPKLSRSFQFTPAQVLVLGFAAAILTGAFLLWLPYAHEPGLSISFVDALFTATSAVCVTGLIVVDTATQFSLAGELTVLGLIQIGGLGIMTLSALMLLMMGRRISLSERLLMQEALGSFSIAGVVRLTRNIIFATIAIEAIGAALLFIRFLSKGLPVTQSAYWGMFHAVSAFNNAGFDVTTASLKPFQYDPFILMVIGILITLGGIGFFVMEDVWLQRRWERLTLHSRMVIKVSALLFAVGTLLYLFTEFNNPDTFGPMPLFHKVTNAAFAAITPRTAGFESVGTGTMLDISLFITIILMFIGASPGGTGGGIKTTTFTVIALTIKAMVTGKENPEIMGRRLPTDLVGKAVTIAAISMGLVVTMTCLLLLTEAESLAQGRPGFSFLRLMFEVTTAFGTVGLGTGITGSLTTAGKLLITLTMFIGRVGPLTMAVALAQRKYARDPLRYPEDRVMIG